MYPIECKGNFAVPIKAGSFVIRGVMLTAQSTATACRIVGFDDNAIGSDKQGKVLSSTDLVDRKVPLFDLKGIANVDGTLGVMFPQGIKTRYGLSCYVTNTEPGKIFVYRD